MAIILQQSAYSAAYSGYGGSYTNPQVPTSAPQSATYGAYPATYPAQVSRIILCLCWGSSFSNAFSGKLLIDCISKLHIDDITLNFFFLCLFFFVIIFGRENTGSP